MNSRFRLSTILFGLLLGNLLMESQGWSQQRVSGKIDRDTRWQGQIVLEGDVVVLPGVTLSIEPGTRIQCAPLRDREQAGNDPERVELIVQGRLIAEGFDGAGQILFTSASEEPRMRDWYGIILKNLNEPSVLRNCVVEFAYKGITCYGSAPVIENCEIRFNYYAGVSSEIRARPIIRNCQLVGNDFSGLNCELASTPLVEGCLISQNGTGVMIFDRSQPDLGHYPAREGQSRGENQIFGNFDYNIYHHSIIDVFAQNNSWNTDSEQEIRRQIFDREDSPQYGRVIYRPWRELLQKQALARRARTSSPAPALAAQTASRDTTVAEAPVKSPVAQSPPASPVALPETRKEVASKPLPPVAPEKPEPRIPTEKSTPEERAVRTEQAIPGDRPNAQKRPAGNQIARRQTAEPERPLAGSAKTALQEPVLEPFLDGGRRQYVRKVRPRYPEIYRRTKHEGKVIAEVIVDKNGQVESFRILRSDGEYFTRSVEQALKEYRYRPGTVNGVPVRFKIVEQFIFRLSEGH